MPTDLPEEIRSVVSQLPVLDRVDKFARYADRHGEGVWRITGDGGDFGVRFRPSGGDRPIKTEFERMSRMSQRSVAPEPVAYDDSARWLAYRWVQGEPLLPSRSPDRVALANVAEVCRRMHAAAPFGGLPLDQATSLEADLTSLGGRSALPDGFASWRDRALELARRLTASAKAAPCHNDLFPANIVVARQGRCTLIDWEYAADNDPASDLASFAVSASLGPADVESLVGLYVTAGSGPAGSPDAATEFELSRVRGWMLVAAVAWLPWALADHTMPAETRAHWAQWARMRYENVTSAMTRRDFERLIESCG